MALACCPIANVPLSLGSRRACAYSRTAQALPYDYLDDDAGAHNTANKKSLVMPACWPPGGTPQISRDLKGPAANGRNPANTVTSESYSRSGAWEFFTEDYQSSLRSRRRSAQ